MIGATFGRAMEPSSLTRLAVNAERLGYHSVWVPETWGRDAFLLLGAIAQRTDKIRLATGVVNIFSRSPAQLASAVATLNELSGGRAILGLGASGEKVIRDFHGIQFWRPVERMKESVEIIRLLLAGEKADHGGEIFRTKDFALNFRAREAPIYVAALGPRMTELAGKMADGIILYMKPLGEIRKVAGNIKGVAKVACLLPVGEELELRETVAYYIGQMGTHYYASIKSGGFKEEADEIRSLWQKGRKDDAVKAVSAELLSSVTLADNDLKKFQRAVDLPILAFTSKDQDEKYIKGKLEELSSWA